MAANTATPPIVIDSDEEFDDSDEEDAHPLGPAAAPQSLQDAIKSASQPVLAKALLEICEHNEGSKQLATALLSPPHAPQGTKRRASSAELIDRVCERCGYEFDDRERVFMDCRYHPGRRRANPSHEVFEDIDYDDLSDLDDLLDEPEFEAGAIYECCGRGVNEVKCAIREHLVRAVKVAR